MSRVTRRDFMKDSALLSAGVLINGVDGTHPLQEQQPSNVSGDKNSKDRAIENDFVRMAIDPRNGAITSLFNKRSNKEYLKTPAHARSFRLVVPDPQRVTGYNADWSANALDSWDQTNCTLTMQTTSDGQLMTISYPVMESAAGAFPIEVQCSIRLPHHSDEIILQMHLTNRSHFRVTDVFFPWVSGVGTVEGLDLDTLVIPNQIWSLSGLRKSADNGSNWEENPHLGGLLRWPSAYSLSMPWMNYGGSKEGLYLASRCRQGIRHTLVVQDFGSAEDPALAFAWAFVPWVEPGQSWQTPQIVLSLHSGDWHAAADKYRSSLDSWYRKPRAASYSFASFNSFFSKRDFMQIADLAEDIRKYGLNDLVMWNFGDYYPNVMDEDDLTVNPPRLGEFTSQWGGLSRLQKANAIAESLGVRTGIIFSQLLWNKNTLTPDLQALAEKWTIRTAAGDPITQSWTHQHFGATPWSHDDSYFGYNEYVMCGAVTEFQQFAIDNIVGVLSKGGYSTMFFDEAIVSFLCFSPEHHHSTVSAPSADSHVFLESMAQAMREKNPHWRLSGEGWELLASQSLDMGWTWGGEFGAEVFRYTLPWARVARAVSMNPADANRNFILGVHLALIPKGIENDKTLSDFPAFARHLASLAAFWNTTERFWTDGVFADDLGLTVDGGFAKIYTLPDEMAVMMANLTDQPSKAAFELDSLRHAIDGTSFSLASLSGQTSPGKAQANDGKLRGSLTLRGYEVVALIFRRHSQNH